MWLVRTSAAPETMSYFAPRVQIDFLGEEEGFGTPSSLLPCIPVKKALQEARRGTKRGLPKALESRRKIHPATRSRVVQNTQCASDAKVTPLSFPAPPAFVHEQKDVLAVLLRQHDGFTLTLAQPSQVWVRRGRNSFNL